jgi:Glycosyl hydrolase family 99
MKVAFALLVAAVAAPTASAAQPRWTLREARAALATHDFPVIDASQLDRPLYDLVFTRRQAKALRRTASGFGYAGLAHDRITVDDIPVRFTLTTRRTLVGFRGPPADVSQPAYPIRATFYYAWYPEAWTRAALFPYSRFHPSLDYYAGNDGLVIRAHVDAMRYAHLGAAIYSWWGRGGYPPTDERFWRYLEAARGTPFRWAIYYEREGYENPTVEKIRSDLGYIRDLYASKPAYLKVDGSFVVFVYADGTDSCETAARWAAANTVGAYVVLSGFSGWAECPWQPQAWHQYSADREEYTFAPTSFMISPGFDEAGSPAPARTRDPARWRHDVADMVASGAPWQLVISFNEWAEGTAVESAREWETPSGHGAYLDALHELVP